MNQYTTEQYAALLLRTFTPRFSRDNAPRVRTDVTDKGEEFIELTLPHPTEPRFSVSLEVSSYKKAVSTCALWFGQAEITGHLDPDKAIPAIEEILDGRIVALVRYKTEVGYDNRRKASSGGIQWLYQLPDDETELEAMLTRLRHPAGFFEKITANMTGVFEAYRWDACETIRR